MLEDRDYCAVCGVPVTSCVLPAYCVRCDPAFIGMWRRVHEEAESARLNAKSSCRGSAAEGEEGHGDQEVD